MHIKENGVNEYSRLLEKVYVIGSKKKNGERRIYLGRDEEENRIH